MFMFEKAFVGSRRYWVWILCLAGIILAGFLCYLRQLTFGLVITGLSRDVTWGLYIAQFTFFVGVAASAVMVVLPYYLHDYKQFGRITILGEFLAVGAVTMCMLFVFVDMGQPSRVLNVLRYPTPWSLMFWDFVSLGGYLLLNVLISLVMLGSERQGVSPPRWIKPIIILSIPWAVSIHTVTAFLYSGLPGRTFWMTAVLAPRFLASAFASGPALLILLCLVLRKVARFDAGREAIQQLGIIVAYATVINVFLVLVETFTVFYSHIPEHIQHFQYVFLGLDGNYHLAPWMWLSVLLSVSALVLLLVPKWRHSPRLLPVACVFVFVSLWLDKGLGLIVGGFTPSPLGAVTTYTPTWPEAAIVLGVWGIGALMITVFYKIALSVREAH
ncbi:MAG TPA: NrfD/PsrC family molybdoenzyme membrane anchor subunit [Candidatus Acidoferrum sp.]|nr:NrfD/PsrC family molybdoenzyme membrane anchor subunit [Candidatus Acidoferrum sp.]